MDEEEIAESQDGTERLAIDDFRFESFPAIWPATEKKLKTIQDVLLSADQIQELRRFQSWTSSRNQRSSSSNWTYKSWYAYFNLQLPPSFETNSSARTILHKLAGRKLPTEPSQKRVKIKSKYARVDSLDEEAIVSMEAETVSICEAQAVDKAVSAQASVDAQEGEIPQQGKGFLLYEGCGGPNIILQLECGNSGAANPHARKLLESKDNETTVDIRADPALCAGCQYWAGSDGKYPPFAD
jgi:hypothetical protein